MAVSAFKSTSRRGNLSSTSSIAPPPAPASAGGAGKAAQSTKKVVPPRRSRSVSACSRGGLDVDLDFSNKRENPLYWAADVDSPRLEGGGGMKVARFDGAGSGSSGVGSKVSGAGCGVGVGGESRRGRSVTRFVDCGGKSTAPGGGGGRGVGRSLSRVDTGRRTRSVSRGHCGYSEPESEREQDSRSLRSRSKTDSNARCVDVVHKSAVARSDSDLSELLKGYGTWSSHHPALEASDGSAVSQSSSFLPHWEDGGSMSSFSDADERNNKPVSELVNVMRRSRSSSTLSTNTDMRHEPASPAEAELVLEVRGEYARRLEESQERARKLRAELAVEEHRGVELNNILENIITHPETPDVKKPRAVRKASMERRKMSKRLEEEALAYFDECVSISTFDGSEFSSLEDPPCNAVLSAEQHGNKVNLHGSTYVSIDPSHFQSSAPNNPTLQKNTACRSTGVESSSTSGLSSLRSSWKRQFSFADKRKDSSVLEQELRSYVKIFTKDGAGKEISSSRMEKLKRYHADEYVLSVPAEKLLFDRVAFKNRIVSGGMLLCGGAAVMW